MSITFDGSTATRDRLIDAAISATGLDDFGAPTWQEGLDLYLESLEASAKLNDIGVGVVEDGIVKDLSNRLQIEEWRKTHPAVAEEQIVRPIIIVGQPRTGTSILHDLMAQDPANRAPLSWEVERPVPTAHVEDAWGCRVRKVGRSYMLTAAERVVALAMMYVRGEDFQTMARVDVPWSDWSVVVPQAREVRVPALVIVAYRDSVRYCDADKIGPPVVLLTGLQPAVRIQAGKLGPLRPDREAGHAAQCRVECGPCQPVVADRQHLLADGVGEVLAGANQLEGAAQHRVVLQLGELQDPLAARHDDVAEHGEERLAVA